MKPGWIIGIVVLFIGLQVFAGICEMSWAVGTSHTTTLQDILNPDFPDYKGPAVVVAYLTVGWEYVQLLWRVFWFDYPFFEGTWQMLRYILFIPVSIGLVVSLVLAIIRGVSSG